MARIVRGEFLSLREQEFVEAARADGRVGARASCSRHLLPNSMGPIVVFFTLEIGLAILTEATLSFLGAGIQLPDVSLGNMISDAEDTVGTDLSYLILFPGLVLFLVVLCGRTSSATGPRRARPDRPMAERGERGCRTPVLERSRQTLLEVRDLQTESGSSARWCRRWTA